MTETPQTAAEREVARREQALTDEVVASFGRTADPRTRELLQCLVRHLHAYAREVRLTQAEWEQAVAFLTRAGQITTDRRQEVILLSDVLGLSMLTVGINAPQSPEATESTVFGPFFVQDSPQVTYGADVAEGMSGEPCWVEGRVTALGGRPLAGARIEVWEADDDGFYDVQYSDGRLTGRAHMFSDDDGRYGFWSVRPSAYPIPHDGPVGDLLRAAVRSPMRPAHIHFMVRADGFETLVTHVFEAGGPHLEDDAVFGVKESLVYELSEHPPGAGPAGRALDERWWGLAFDIRLVPTAKGNHER
ncbi:MAG TPA: dioxygenase [Conexibacter sp.]|jgi:hydroxyquinol 1,2-dioxygenase